MTARIAERIGNEMEAKGVSISGLSEKAGIPRVTLQRRLAKPDSFTIGELDAIASALDCGTGLELLASTPNTKRHSGHAA